MIYNIHMIKNKYLKYKNKNIFGGNLEKHEILSFIESIGYEFESPYIMPLIYNDEEKKFTFDKCRNVKHRYILNDKYNVDFISKVDSTAKDDLDVPIYKLLNNDEITTWIYYNDDYKTFDFGKNIFHSEFIYTFTNFKKSNNIIKETMLESIKSLKYYFKTKYLLESDIDILKNGVVSNDLIYLYINRYRDEDDNYNMYLVSQNDRGDSIEDAKFMPQMTVGVKIQHIESIFFYFSKEHIKLNDFLKKIKKEKQLIISNFSKYLKIKTITISKKSYNVINNLLFIVLYITNLYINIYKQTKVEDRIYLSTINREKFPLYIRQTEKQINRYLITNYSLELNHFVNFIEDFKTKIIEIDNAMYRKYISNSESLELEHKKTYNLFEHLLLYNKYESRFSDDTPINIYEIKDDILLIENRMFIKDLTKIYDRQTPLTLDELETIVNKM